MSSKLRFGLVVVIAVVLITGGFLFGARIIEKMSHGRKTAAEEEVFKKAQAEQSAGQLLKAREDYQKLISEYPQGKLLSESQKAIEALNINILFSNAPTQDSKSYMVQPKDSLEKISKQFGTTVELLKRSNGLSSGLIRPGQKLKIATAKFSILVSKSQNTLTLKANDDICKVYTVATGTNNSTPVGTFKIVNKEMNPVWYKKSGSSGAIVPPDSPANILGTRWLGISVPGYGIHGTTQPESLGKQATAGCVRMMNKEVEELYAIVPVGTEVTIVD